MAYDEDIQHAEKIITTKSRRLRELEAQKARFGLHTPPHITMEIEDITGEIREGRDRLRRLREGRPTSDDLVISVGDDAPSLVTTAVPTPQRTAATRWVPIVLALFGLVLVAGLGIVAAGSLSDAPETASPAPAGPTGELPAQSVVSNPTLEPMPANGVNIAVAEFTSATGDPLLKPEDGYNLRDGLVAAMDVTLEDLDPILRIGEVRPLEAVPDGDPAQRERHVAELAQSLNATVVLYGRIAPLANGAYQVYPEFYISPGSHGFDYGAEIVGATQFGQPVQFTPPLNAPEMAVVNAQLLARIEALQHVVLGLSNFGIRRDDVAYTEYNLALQRLQQSAPDETGQEVLQLLLGAVKLREFQRFSGLGLDPAVQPDEKQAEAARQQADLHFTLGMAANPKYARLNLGLGAIALAQATQLIPVSGPWPEAIESRLVDAYFLYTQALPAPDEQSPYGYVSVKARFGAAQAQMGLYSYYQQDPAAAADNPQLAQSAYREAELGLKQVVSAYRGAGQPPQLLEMAGQAQALLAKLLLLEAMYLERIGQSEVAQSLWQQVIAACDQAFPLLQQKEQDSSRLAIYYHAQCLDWQATVYHLAKPPDPAAATTACAAAVPLGVNSGVLQPEEFNCLLFETAERDVE